MAEALGRRGQATATMRAGPGSLVIDLPGHLEVPVPLGGAGVTEAVITPGGPAGPQALELRDSRGHALVVLAGDAWPTDALDEVLATAGVRRRDYTRRATPSGTDPLVLWPETEAARSGADLILLQLVTVVPAGVVALVGAVRARVSDGYRSGVGWPTDGWLLAAAVLVAVAGAAGLVMMRRTPDRPEVVARLGQTGVVALVLLGAALAHHSAAPAVLAAAVAVVAIGAALRAWWRLK